MEQEHYARLRGAVHAFDTNDTRKLYQTGRFVRSDRVKNLDMRYRWDLFHVASHIDPGLRKELYKYLNDNHIDTALRRIVEPIERPTYLDAGGSDAGGSESGDPERG